MITAAWLYICIYILVGSISAGNKKMNYMLFLYSGVNYYVLSLFKMLFIPKTQDGIFVCYMILSVSYGISS